MGTSYTALFRQIEILRAISDKQGRYISTGTIQTVLEGKGFSVEARTLQRNLEALKEHFDLNCDDSKNEYKCSFKCKSPINFESMDTL
jgi:Fe2+ or Zn2+ uptake regulation protein